MVFRGGCGGETRAAGIAQRESRSGDHAGTGDGTRTVKLTILGGSSERDALVVTMGVVVVVVVRRREKFSTPAEQKTG